jgi:hypothetical protein
MKMYHVVRDFTHGPKKAFKFRVAKADVFLKFCIGIVGFFFF